MINKTKTMLDKCLPDSAPSMEMIQKWFTDFLCDRTSADNTERSGCSKDVSNSEKVEKIHDFMLNNPKVNFWQFVTYQT